jgi:hypothetical protein
MTVRTDHTRPPAERRLLQRNTVATAVYLAARGQPLRRFRASNLSALGVFVEAGDTGLHVGQVVSLIFPVPVEGIIRLHRKKAVVAHVSSRGAGLMMQGRLRRPRQG